MRIFGRRKPFPVDIEVVERLEQRIRTLEGARRRDQVDLSELKEGVAKILELMGGSVMRRESEGGVEPTAEQTPRSDDVPTGDAPAEPGSTDASADGEATETEGEEVGHATPDDEAASGRPPAPVEAEEGRFGETTPADPPSRQGAHEGAQQAGSDQGPSPATSDGGDSTATPGEGAALPDLGESAGPEPAPSGPDIPKPEPTPPGPTPDPTSPDALDQFLVRRTLFHEEGYGASRDRLVDARANFALWRDYVVDLWGAWQDHVRDGVRDVLEDPRYKLSQDDHQMVYPLNPKNTEVAAGRLKQLAESIADISEPGSDDWLSGLPGVSFRHRAASDYRLLDDKVPAATVTFLRDATATLVVIMKKLERARLALGDLLASAVTTEAEVDRSLDTLDGRFLESLGPDGRETIWVPSEDEVHGLLQDNERVARDAGEAAERFEKRYLKFLSTHLVDAVNDLYTARQHYREAKGAFEGPDREFLDGWGSLYDQLMELFLGPVMGERLHLEPINCERGDAFDPIFHAGVFAEPDPKLQDDQIKEVSRVGFVWSDGQRDPLVVKESDVVVVKNSS